MKLALGLRLQRREHQKQAKHYRRMIRYNEQQLKRYPPGSASRQNFSDVANSYRRLLAEATAEEEKLTKRIKSAES
jgi:hypothetical protein